MNIKSIIKTNKILYSYLLYFKYLTRNKSTRANNNIFMLHIGRVGSTVIADLLNQHSKFSWSGEIYPNKKDKYLKFIYKNHELLLKIRMYQHHSDFFGFELKTASRQILKKNTIGMDLECFLSLLEKHHFKHFIILERKNYLRQFVSFYNAKITKIHHVSEKPKHANKINFNPNNCLFLNKHSTLIDHFEYLDKHYSNLKTILKNKQVLHLNYEDDILETPLIAYEKICNFIHIKPEKPIINLKQTNAFPLEDLIENIEDIKKHLKGSKYEWMLS